MKLSFVIPVYKPDYTIFKRCLQSLQDQSFKEWEAIVVLDGPDEKAESIASTYKQIKTIKLPHGGVQRARNEGFGKTKGEYVCFWDCDCIIEPDWSKRCIDHMEANSDISFVYSGYKFLEEMGGIVSEPFDPWRLKIENYISTMFPMRRRVFPGFDESLKSLQDWDMWLTIVENGNKGIFFPGYAFSTAYPTEHSISGKGCTESVWLDRVKAIKIKHNLPDRKVCVSSLGYREEGIKLAKTIDADYKDIPNYKPNNYESIIQYGFSLHPQKVTQHASIFKQTGLKNKVIFWTENDILEINNFISLKALQLYASRLNLQSKQYVEDLSAKKIMEAAGFNVQVRPCPLINTDNIESMPVTPRVLVDMTDEYQQVLTVLEHSLPDIKLDLLTANKSIKDYSALICLNTEKTLSNNMKRMLLTGRTVISNVSSPFCGYVSDESLNKMISEIVEKVRGSNKKNNNPALDYWTKELDPKWLQEILK